MAENTKKRKPLREEIQKDNHYRFNGLPKKSQKHEFVQRGVRFETSLLRDGFLLAHWAQHEVIGLCSAVAAAAKLFGQTSEG